MDVSNMPQDPARRWEWIKYQLRVRNNSMAELARQLNVTDRAIRNAKHTPYPRIERAIATALGLQPMQIWPERWNLDGTPYRQRPKRAESNAKYRNKDTGLYPVRHRKTCTEC